MRSQNLVGHYREQAGLTQEQLAQEVGVQRTTLTDWEQRGVANAKSLIRLAELFIQKYHVITDYRTAQQFWQHSGRKDFAEPPELRRWFETESVSDQAAAGPAPASGEHSVTPQPAPHTSEQRPALTPDSPLAGQVADSAPTQPRDVKKRTPTKNRRWLYGVGLGALLGLAILVAFVVFQGDGRGYVVIVDPLPAPLVQLPLYAVSGRSIRSNDTLRVGDVVRTAFTIRNVGTTPVRIQNLVASVGFQSACENPDSIKWRTPNFHFPADTHFVLQPNADHTYQASYTFSAPGTYFVEPTFQFEAGDWHGFSPAPCTNVIVTP